MPTILFYWMTKVLSNITFGDSDKSGPAPAVTELNFLVQIFPFFNSNIWMLIQSVYNKIRRPAELNIYLSLDFGNNQQARPDLTKPEPPRWYRLFVPHIIWIFDISASASLVSQESAIGLWNFLLQDREDRTSWEICWKFCWCVLPREERQTLTPPSPSHTSEIFQS